MADLTEEEIAFELGSALDWKESIILERTKEEEKAGIFKKKLSKMRQGPKEGKA